MTGKASGFFENIRTCFLARNSVVLPMATKAIGNLFMATEENRTGLLMIEIFVIKKNDGLIHSLVFGMTDYAVVTFVTMIPPIL